MFQLLDHQVNMSFLFIQGIWKGMDKAINLVNVYSHCAFNEKLALWEELLQLRRTVGEGLWCVVGDFNVIRCLERVGNNGGIQQRGREILEFNNFIENMELVELHSVGRKFSRIKEAGNAMSRLERALVLIKWLNLWPNATQYVLDRSISDHFPFLVNHINVD